MNKRKPEHPDAITTVFPNFKHYEREFLIYMSGFTEQELIEDMHIKKRLSKETSTSILTEYKFELFKEENPKFGEQDRVNIYEKIHK
jgi:predicted Zn-dependent protease with MMP-like domain